jgi:hypothetical protein
MPSLREYWQRVSVTWRANRAVSEKGAKRHSPDSALAYTFLVHEPIRIRTAERDGEDGLLVTFSDGTITGYVAEAFWS